MRILYSALLSLFFCFHITCPAWAQEKKDKEVFTLDEMSVTATKTDREVKDVPTDITVITKEDIKKYQPLDVMDLLRHVPGLTINGLGSEKLLTSAGMRGMQPSLKGVMVMVDGIEMNTPNNFIMNLNIPIENIERIDPLCQYT